MENAAEGRWSVANFSSLPFYSFSLSFSTFFRWCHGVVVLLVLWFWNSSFRLENGGDRNHAVGSGISFQRCGLAYLDISKWSAVQINANRAGFSFGRERLRMPARRRLCSSSVRVLRSDGVIHPGTRGDLGT